MSVERGESGRVYLRERDMWRERFAIERIAVLAPGVIVRNHAERGTRLAPIDVLDEHCDASLVEVIQRVRTLQREIEDGARYAIAPRIQIELAREERELISLSRERAHFIDDTTFVLGMGVQTHDGAMRETQIAFNDWSSIKKGIHLLDELVRWPDVDEILHIPPKHELP